MTDQLGKLSTKELRAALERRGVDSSGCLEKSELVALLLERPSPKRQRLTEPPAASAAAMSEGPFSLVEAASREETLLGRLACALPPLDRRLKEPDTAQLFAPHAVPLAATHQLRVCTFNLLDDIRVERGQGGIHSVWDVRRINVLRCLVAIDADAYLFQELSHKSLTFLQATLGHEYDLEAWCGQQGVLGVMYRRAPRRDRPVHFAPVGPSIRRRMRSPTHVPPSGALIGIAMHVPLECRGLGEGRAPFTIVLSTTHLAHMERGQLQSSNKLGSTFAAHLGRDLVRLPRKHSCCPMILGGDFNTSADGKKARARQAPSLYAELTQPIRRVYDSEDEWEEDAEADADGLPRWPPTDARPLACDLWREASAREYGGLVRGSTCSSWVTMQGVGGQQGVRARRIREGWSADAECTDEGHIDWLLASHAHSSSAVQPRLSAVRAVIGTELVVPPLPPLQPSLIGPTNIPADGCLFPSDHYPVFADLEVEREVLNHE